MNGLLLVYLQFIYRLLGTKILIAQIFLTEPALRGWQGCHPIPPHHHVSTSAHSLAFIVSLFASHSPTGCSEPQVNTLVTSFAISHHKPEPTAPNRRSRTHLLPIGTNTGRQSTHFWALLLPVFSLEADPHPWDSPELSRPADTVHSLPSPSPPSTGKEQQRWLRRHCSALSSLQHSQGPICSEG